jgi:hypothetical protein
MANTPLDRFFDRHSRIVEKAVSNCFEPMAKKHGLKIYKIRQCVYEIPAPYFVLRIELDGECDSGIVVTLRDMSIRAVVERVSRVHYNISWI